MKIKQLVKDIINITVKGSKDIEISGITSNSKMVSPGNLFVARRGAVSDGNAFIPEALQAGAVAVLTDIFDPSLRDIVQIITPFVTDIEAALAASYYKQASQDLFMIGVTGTSGKTTTTYAIRHILERAKIRSGLIGTIEYITGDARYPATRTTPDVVANQRMLREMVRQGSQACVMEVTSHALEQKRVAHIEFDVAIFTNLTHEHLDYHQSMESYCMAKQKLFKTLKSSASSKKAHLAKMAIFNADSPWYEKMKEGCPARIFTFAIDCEADLKAINITFSSAGSHFTVAYQQEHCDFFWPLVGRFNVYNALSVISAGLAKGLQLREIKEYLASFDLAPGRLERVDNSLGLNIYVDYAHKEDALKNVLIALRECTKGKIITVFGCGGDRDREKRPKMAHAAELLSDIVIVTSDNPRSENPQAIANEIVTGFQKPSLHTVELDRKKAIEMAIDAATSNDIVLIAGKGHETKQYFHHHTVDFDDRLVAKEYCAVKATKEISV